MASKLIGYLGILALALSLTAGCGGEEDPGVLGTCPPNSQEQQDYGSFILFTTCTGCHSQNLEGDDRYGAPLGSDFDNIDLIKAQAEDIYLRSIDGTMPPPNTDPPMPGLNENQLESLRAYLVCLP